MAQVQATIPDGLAAEVEAALAWWNGTQDLDFEVTGILDPDAALASAGARELRLVLCGGDRCEQQSFRVTPSDAGYEVQLADDAAPVSGSPQAELDPPPGARRSWLDRALSQHAFVVLVFYRGFW
ncbi:MAG: hypothetical protein AAF430_17775 [Myxococcota bacterium]